MSNNSSSPIVLTPSKATTIFMCTGLITFSILGLIISATTALVITLSKPMHTTCFTLIAGGSIGSFMVAAHYLGRGINKLRLETGLIGNRRTALECLFMDGVFGLWGLAFHSVMSCMIAIDRLISTIAPIRYRRLGTPYAIKVLAVCAILMVVEELVGFLTAPLFTELTCTDLNQAVHPTFFKFFAMSNLCYSCLNVAAYVAMLIAFHYQQKFADGDGVVADSFTKQQASVIPSIKLMACLYFFTGILAEVFINTKPALPPGELAFVVGSIGSVLKDASSMVEGMALMIRSQRFRECLRQLVNGNKSNVITAQSNLTNGASIRSGK